MASWWSNYVPTSLASNMWNPLNFWGGSETQQTSPPAPPPAPPPALVDRDPQQDLMDRVRLNRSLSTGSKARATRAIASLDELKRAISARRNDVVEAHAASEALCVTPELNSRFGIDVYGRDSRGEEPFCPDAADVVTFRNGRYCCSKEQASATDQMAYWSMVLKNIIEQQSRLPVLAALTNPDQLERARHMHRYLRTKETHVLNQINRLQDHLSPGAESYYD